MDYQALTFINWGMVAWDGLLMIRNLIFLCSTSDGAPGKLRCPLLAVILTVSLSNFSKNVTISLEEAKLCIYLMDDTLYCIQ